MSLSRSIAQTVLKQNNTGSDLVDVLRRYNLLSLLSSIKEEMKKLTEREAAKDIIQIESPFPLNDKALGRIKRIVGNDLADAEVTINQHLLAGFKARYKGKVYDGSAERIIKQFIK